MGGPDFCENVDALLRNLPKLLKLFPPLGTTKGNIRRLSCIEDRECKTRVIAILDYFSQSVLRPVHDYLFGLLRRIPQDCTFDQDSFRSKVKDWDYFLSIDLSSATDRFPIWVIVFVLSIRFGQDWAVA